MRVGVFAKTFEGDHPATVLAASRDAGFGTVQYNMACSGLGSLPEAISEDAAREVREASAGTGIGIAAISATYNMTDPDPERLAAGRRALRGPQAKFLTVHHAEHVARSRQVGAGS